MQQFIAWRSMGTTCPHCHSRVDGAVSRIALPATPSPQEGPSEPRMSLMANTKGEGEGDTLISKDLDRSTHYDQA
jgi:hypothetical protein